MLPSATIIPVEQLMLEMMGPEPHHALALNFRWSAVTKGYHGSCWVAGRDGWIQSGPSPTLAGCVADLHKQYIKKVNP